MSLFAVVERNFENAFVLIVNLFFRPYL